MNKQEYTLRAEDKKTLLIFRRGEARVPERAAATWDTLYNTLCGAIGKRIAPRIKENYRQNKDGEKRAHVPAFVCTLDAEMRDEGGEKRAVFLFTVRRSGKITAVEEFSLPCGEEDSKYLYRAPTGKIKKGGGAKNK